MTLYIKILLGILLLSTTNARNIDEINQDLDESPSARSLTKCKSWYDQQPPASQYIDKIQAAPCRIPPSFPSTLIGNWKTDPACAATKQPNTCSYHIGAWGCYRHSYKTTGPGSQACYDKDGNWLSDPWKGAGTLDAETPLGSLLQQVKHYNADVVPFDNCCKASGVPQPSTCNMYFEKRPPGVCVDKPAI